MPKVPLAGLSSWACLGTSAAMSKYCFWLSHRWLCCKRIEQGTIFTSAGLCCANVQNNASIPPSSSCSGAGQRAARTTSKVVACVRGSEPVIGNITRRLLASCTIWSGFMTYCFSEFSNTCQHLVCSKFATHTIKTVQKLSADSSHPQKKCHIGEESDAKAFVC